jgi:hypothetical protein
MDKGAAPNLVQRAEGARAAVADPVRVLPDPGTKEVNRLPNPLAIPMDLGGLLLDLLVPRPKPRAGLPPEASPHPQRAVPRTPRRDRRAEEYDGRLVVSGRR